MLPKQLLAQVKSYPNFELPVLTHPPHRSSEAQPFRKEVEKMRKLGEGSEEVVQVPLFTAPAIMPLMLVGHRYLDRCCRCDSQVKLQQYQLGYGLYLDRYLPPNYHPDGFLLIRARSRSLESTHLNCRRSLSIEHQPDQD